MDKKSILLGAAAFFAASLSAQDVQMKQDEKKEGKKEIINPFYGDYPGHRKGYRDRKGGNKGHNGQSGRAHF